MKRSRTSWTIKFSKYLQHKVIYILYSLKSPCETIKKKNQDYKDSCGRLLRSNLLLLCVNVIRVYENFIKAHSEENGPRLFKSQQLIFNKMTAFVFTQALRSYFDVVFGPVDTADGHAQAAQAALIHVTGNGAAHTQRAQQGEPAWLREIETTQEKPTVCTWKDSWKGIRCAHKLCSPRSAQRGWSGNLKVGICLVGWSQPWSQIWPGEWQGFVCFWASEIV